MEVKNMTKKQVLEHIEFLQHQAYEHSRYALRNVTKTGALSVWKYNSHLSQRYSEQARSELFAVIDGTATYFNKEILE